MKAIGIIPARYGSTRFPGKPLIDILGKSMIQRVYEQCSRSSMLTKIIVATDDKRIYKHVIGFGGEAMMTSKTHKTGTERCNEVVKNINPKVGVIVNIQGDEPFINPLQIDEVVSLFNNPKTQIGTLIKEINDITILKDKNSPKAIINKDGNALNFCRIINNPSEKETYYKHVGLYAYTKEILSEICQLSQSKNELNESLEQLRWLDNNYTIKVGETSFKTISIDTKEDLKKIKQKMR